MITARRLRYARHFRAKCTKPSRELRGASIDGGFIVAWRLEAHESLDGLSHPD
jgi:hypothetical protein